MYKSIFVPVDNSDHSNACEVLSIELAAATGAKVTGNHVYAAKLHDIRFKQMEFTLPEEYKEETELEKQRRIHDALITRGLQLISDSYLDRMDTMAQDKGVTFERHMSDGRNFEALVEDINENDYDLVIMGAVGQGAVRQSTVGSVVERTLRRTNTDTMIVRDIDNATLEQEGAIVVALDGSTWSWGAMQTACELAKTNKRPLEIVAVHNPDQSGEELIEAHLSLARQVARNHELKVSTTLLDGSAATALVEHLENSRPWLVLAGRHGLDTAEQESNIGSVTEHLLRFGPSNLLIISREWTPSEATRQQIATS
ncbi:MAG TPA: universal stress protein [Myxococcales bacterium]|nr:universal stress protein [Myxococcales bacterium]